MYTDFLTLHEWGFLIFSVFLRIRVIVGSSSQKRELAHRRISSLHSRPRDPLSSSWYCRVCSRSSVLSQLLPSQAFKDPDYSWAWPNFLAEEILPGSWLGRDFGCPQDGCWVDPWSRRTCLSIQSSTNPDSLHDSSHPKLSDNHTQDQLALDSRQVEPSWAARSMKMVRKEFRRPEGFRCRTLSLASSVSCRCSSSHPFPKTATNWFLTPGCHLVS